MLEIQVPAMKANLEQLKSFLNQQEAALKSQEQISKQLQGKSEIMKTEH